MKRISRCPLVLTWCASCLLAANDNATAQPTPGSRLINFSVLTSINSAGDTFTLGYVVGGSGTTGTKPLVIRAAGPSLGVLGIPGTLDDPKIELFAGATKVSENDNWGGSASIANAMSAVGAFAYMGQTSRDAAVALSVASGDNSVRVSAIGNGTGTVLAEIFDATPPASFTTTTPRLVNASVLKQLGTGFTVGFVVGGSGPKNLLVRAIGPTLGTAFGVSGAVADPQFLIYAGQTVIASNDNWGGTTALKVAFASAGAFALPEASRDAAAMISLPPDSYTVRVSGIGNTTGNALVEVYELPAGLAPTGFALIPAGTFTMGDNLDRDPRAQPTHAVTLSAFYLAKTETTWTEWVVVRDWSVTHGYTDLVGVGMGQADTHPVHSVTWYEMVKWCNAKSEIDGLVPVYYTDDAQTTVYRTGSVGVTNAQVKWSANGYRLPTEAEWEYAARGGLAGRRFPWGDTITHSQANYYSETSYSYDVSPTRGSHPTYAPTYATGLSQFMSPVGAFAANGYGLFDMAGNVWEWCWDWYGSYDSAAVTAPLGPTSGAYRVDRGGSAGIGANFVRVAYRGSDDPAHRIHGRGFRLARSSVP